MGCKKGVWHKTWSQQKKLEIVQLYLDEKVAPMELNKRYGVDPSLVHVWSRLYLKHGAEGLQRRSKVVAKASTKVVE